MSIFLMIILSCTALTFIFSLIANLLKSAKLKKIDKVLGLIRGSVVLLVCIYAAVFQPPTHASDTAWSILGIVLVFAFLLFLNTLHKRKMERTTNALERIRQELTAARDHPLFTHFLIRGDHIHFRTPLEKDLNDILHFDDLVTAGADAAIPQMRTKEGKDYWDRYIRCYLQSRIQKPEQEQAEDLLVAGGWKCTCGRVNPRYTSTCVCGKNKRDVVTV